MKDSCHRQRYRCLSDRRRLGFELERLWARLERHPAWESVPPARRRQLEALLDSPERPATDPVCHLECELQSTTYRLVELARAWHDLETSTVRTSNG